MAAHRIALIKKEQEKFRWLNSPNNYHKVEFYEKNSDRPKIITKVFLIFIKKITLNYLKTNYSKR